MKINKWLYILLFVLATSNAEMYKWVDEEGNTQYSQHAPTQLEATKIPPPLKAASTADEESKRFLDIGKQIEENKKLKAKKQLDEEQKAKIKKTNQQNCNKAKAKHASLQVSNKYRDEFGNLMVLTFEGKQAAIKQAQLDIKQYCNNN
jgi:hypothetical protein